MPRHRHISNHISVHIYVFGNYSPPADDAIYELTYLLAGTGTSTRPGAFTWHGSGNDDHRELRYTWLPTSLSINPLRPMNLLHWQPDPHCHREQLQPGAASDPETALQALAELAALSSDPQIPDGLIPSALQQVFSALGTPGAEAAAACSAIITAQCETLHWAELTRARRILHGLQAMGLTLPSFGDHSPQQTTTSCDACGHLVCRLIHLSLIHI